MEERNAERFRNLWEDGPLASHRRFLMHNDGKQVVETAVEARGGLLGRPVLLVLVVSCVLAVAALIITYSGV
jgi:hypothetical protein